MGVNFIFMQHNPKVQAILLWSTGFFLLVNTDSKDLTSWYEELFVRTYLCVGGCVYQPCSVFFLLWESPGPNMCKTLWGPTIASTNTHTTITQQPTNSSICLPPDTASFVAALKAERLFPLFPGKWILYQLCVCKSVLHFEESRGYYSYLLHCICKSTTI